MDGFGSAAPRRGRERVRGRKKSAGVDSSLPPFPPDRPKIDVRGVLGPDFGDFWAAPNLDLVFVMSFFELFPILGPRGAPFWDLFPAFWHQFSDYEMCIHILSILGWILTSFSMVF